MIPSYGIIYKAFFDPGHNFIVYLGKLQEIAMALNIILSQTNLQINKATIFTIIGLTQ